MVRYSHHPCHLHLASAVKFTARIPTCPYWYAQSDLAGNFLLRELPRRGLPGITRESGLTASREQTWQPVRPRWLTSRHITGNTSAIEPGAGHKVHATA
jgi:hypothetical protein